MALSEFLTKEFIISEVRKLTGKTIKVKRAWNGTVFSYKRAYVVLTVSAAADYNKQTSKEYWNLDQTVDFPIRVAKALNILK